MRFWLAAVIMLFLIGSVSAVSYAVSADNQYVYGYYATGDSVDTIGISVLCNDADGASGLNQWFWTKLSSSIQKSVIVKIDTQTIPHYMNLELRDSKKIIGDQNSWVDGTGASGDPFRYAILPGKTYLFQTEPSNNQIRVKTLKQEAPGTITIASHYTDYCKADTQKTLYVCDAINDISKGCPFGTCCEFRSCKTDGSAWDTEADDYNPVGSTEEVASDGSECPGGINCVTIMEKRDCNYGWSLWYYTFSTSDGDIIQTDSRVTNPWFVPTTKKLIILPTNTNEIKASAVCAMDSKVKAIQKYITPKNGVVQVHLTYDCTIDTVGNANDFTVEIRKNDADKSFYGVYSKISGDAMNLKFITSRFSANPLPGQ